MLLWRDHMSMLAGRGGAGAMLRARSGWLSAPFAGTAHQSAVNRQPRLAVFVGEHVRKHPGSPLPGRMPTPISTSATSSALPAGRYLPATTGWRATTCSWSPAQTRTARSVTVRADAEAPLPGGLRALSWPLQSCSRSWPELRPVYQHPHRQPLPHLAGYLPGAQGARLPAAISRPSCSGTRRPKALPARTATWMGRVLHLPLSQRARRPVRQLPATC